MILLLLYVFFAFFCRFVSLLFAICDLGLGICDLRFGLWERTGWFGLVWFGLL